MTTAMYDLRARINDFSGNLISCNKKNMANYIVKVK